MSLIQSSFPFPFFLINIIPSTPLLLMAAHNQTQPPEAPITSPPGSADVATEAPVAIPQATATASATAPTISTAENGGPPLALATKRQRRPSVRLGEIGDQPAYDSHVRRPTSTRHPWRLPRDSSAASKALPLKARSLTNLVNGDSDNLYVDGNAEFGIRKAKVKRVRSSSNWLPRGDNNDNGAEGDSREDGYAYRHQDDSDIPLPLKDHSSPVQSWRGQIEFDNKSGTSTSEGVRSWLFELGLSRYSPMFEIHEVDDQVLPMLTLEDLKDMGINAVVGSRRKMYAAIQKLRTKAFQ